MLGGYIGKIVTSGTSLPAIESVRSGWYTAHTRCLESMVRLAEHITEAQGLNAVVYCVEAQQPYDYGFVAVTAGLLTALAVILAVGLLRRK